nr:hypothetical protein [uncultured Tolumonas sp.]
MNKEKSVYYQQQNLITGATDLQFSLRQLQTTAWNYSPTVLNQRNLLKHRQTYSANGEWPPKKLRPDDEPL